MLDTLPERLALAKQLHLSPRGVRAGAGRRGQPPRGQLCAAARRAGRNPAMRLETWDDSAAITYDRALCREPTSLRFLDGPHRAFILDRSAWAIRHLATALGHIPPCAAATACSYWAPTTCSSGSRPPRWTNWECQPRVAPP